MRHWAHTLGAALLLVLVMSISSGQDPKGKPSKTDSLNASLREVINHGAALFNDQGDYAGCYRVYQGALIAVRPQLADHPDLLRDIDAALKKAEKMPRIVDRAFVLRGVIDQVRDKVRPAGTEKKKPDDKKPDDKKPEKKPEDKKPDDKKPEKKPEDKKPDDKKPEKKPEDKKPDDKKPDDKKPEKKASLWNRLGGEEGVTKVVGEFMKAASENPKVNVSRDGKFTLDDDAKAEAKKKLVAFFSSVTGGPLKYTGRSMKESHKGMAITDAEFNAAGAELAKVLKNNGVKKEESDELMKIVGATRKDIVEVPAKKADPKKEDKKKDDVKKEDVKKDDVKKEDVKKDVKKEEVKKDDVKKEDVKKDVKKDDAKKDDVKKEEVKKDDAKKADKKTDDKEAARLSGKVLVEGKTGATGYITLVGLDKRVFSTFIHPDGTYAFKIAIPAGEYKIGVESSQKEGAPPLTERFPERFLNPAASGLTLRLQPGANSQELNLTK